MLFSPINIKDELTRLRGNRNSLLQQTQEVLALERLRENDVLDRLSDNTNEGDFLNIKGLEAENIFSLEEIRSVCIRYRLRFLNTTLFRPAFPYEAISQIKSFEKKYNVLVPSFRILAPAETFNLENINKDPLLFIPVDEKSFYLVHKWGKDFSWKRRLLSWPLQNLKTLLISLLMISFIFAISIPSSAMQIFNFKGEFFLRAWLTVHTFIGLFGIAIWLGLSYDKSLSSMSWNSKFYNN